MNPETLKAVASFLPLATPLINALVESRIKPILQEFFKQRDADTLILAEAAGSKFREYLTRTYERHSYLTVLIFPNEPKELRKLYVPITLIGRQTVGRLLGESGEWNVQFSADIKVDTYSDAFLPYYRKVLINDTAGMGKSTLLKFLFLECVDKNKGIPVLIELRRVTKENTLLKLICDDLNAVDEGIDEDFVLKLMRRGDFVFLFDGFDEIPLANREFVTSHLQDFIAKTSSNYFAITSRPDPALASFSDFVGFKIRPLSRQEAYELIVKYDEGGGRAAQLIRDLESDESLSDVKDYLSNPLLVSLLYAYYEYTPDLSFRKRSFKKHLFYRQVYDALFYRHDRSKPGAAIREKRTGLELDDFEKLLRALAYLTFKSGEIEYDTDTVLSRMEEIKTICSDISFHESDLLEDVCLNVPVFVKEGIYYKWQHKSLQEYFAARFILKDVKENIPNLLGRIYRSGEIDRCYNLLSLLYDMDAELFRRTLGRQLAKDFVDYCAADLRMIDLRLVPEEVIQLRQELSFLASVFFMLTSGSKTARWLEELKRGGLYWSETEIPAELKEVLNATGESIQNFKLQFISADQKHIQSAALLSRPAYVIFSILAERDDKLIKKVEYDDSVEALKLIFHTFQSRDDILFSTNSNYPNAVAHTAECLSATNLIMLLSLKDYIHNKVLSLGQCLNLLGQVRNNKQEDDFVLSGW